MSNYVVQAFMAVSDEDEPPYYMVAEIARLHPLRGLDGVAIRL